MADLFTLSRVSLREEGSGRFELKMGLLPLEFSDCLVDSPYFRENLKAHEKQLDQVSWVVVLRSVKR